MTHPDAAPTPAAEATPPPAPGAPVPTRRGFLQRTALGGTAVAGTVALGACSPAAPPQASAPSTPQPGAEGTTGHVVAAASELPRGSKLGVEIEGRNYLLFRPSETSVLAYRALCTHAGCQVQVGDEHDFHCPCHNSEFAPEDGTPTAGPADAPLERFAAEIDGEDVIVHV
ncbi:Rieske (2Fe-2S) protein [Zhihengliuella sp.]|uniref:Rieske (2Fe-2S) protein n=1 Tax=Zhihengliuella sp. TaxID=1954483 RepID=UPI002811970F|nr:Rieske (2Fe-2S) protein [Zhihengliuella sp.]